MAGAPRGFGRCRGRPASPVAAGRGDRGVGEAAALAPAHDRQASRPPKLNHGQLTVGGHERGRHDRAPPRRPAIPAVLQVDIDDDGSADFSFPRADDQLDRASTAAAATTPCASTTATAIFTDTIPTTLDGGNGNDTPDRAAPAPRRWTAATATTRSTGTAATTCPDRGTATTTFVWDPGDGSDTIDGQYGTDAMLFNGANVEKVDLSANGNHLRFFRDVANITMDTDGVETVDFNALGGADVVNVNDLRRTDVDTVNVDLAALGGGGDGPGGPGDRQRHRPQRRESSPTA